MKNHTSVSEAQAVDAAPTKAVRNKRAAKVSPIGESLKLNDDLIMLKEREDIIRHHQGGTFLIGWALGKINSEKLYKAAGFKCADFDAQPVGQKSL